MSDHPYTNRELDERFSDLNRRLFDEQEGYLPRIERQTTKTNGRVNKLERNVVIIVAVFVGYVAAANPLMAKLLALIF